MKSIEMGDTYGQLTYLGDAPDRDYGYRVVHMIHVKCSCGKVYDMPRDRWRRYRKCWSCEREKPSQRNKELEWWGRG